MFPFHTWLPDAHVEAPTAISVILAGVLLKMGTYGILRINFGILPEATQWAAPAMAVFGAINILYGAFCAMAQKDLKKLVAYSSVSHMGLLPARDGRAHADRASRRASCRCSTTASSPAMLFTLVGVVYDRAHTRDIDKFGGLANEMPLYTAFVGFAFMASLGLPGLSGFWGEVMTFIGAFPRLPRADHPRRDRRHHHGRLPPLGAAAHVPRQVPRGVAQRAITSRRSAASSPRSTCARSRRSCRSRCSCSCSASGRGRCSTSSTRASLDRLQHA